MNFIKKISMRTKLIGSFSTIALIAVFIGCFGYYKIHKLDEADIRLYTSVTKPMGQMFTAASIFNDIRIKTLYAGTTSNKEEIENIKNGIESSFTNLQTILSEYETELISKEAKTTLNELKKVLLKYQKSIDAIFTNIEYDNSEQAQSMTLKAKSIAEQCQSQMTSLVESKIYQGNIISLENYELAKNSSNIMIAVAAFGFICAVFLGMYTTSHITKQLGADPTHLSQVANAIASGKFENKTDSSSPLYGVYAVLIDMSTSLKSKISEANEQKENAIKQSLLAENAKNEAEIAKKQAEEAMKEGMSIAAEKIKNTVEGIMDASNEISSKIQQSNSGAEMQSNRITSVAASIEQMNATVLEVAKSASAASETSKTARTEAEVGVDIVTRTIEEIVSAHETSSTMESDILHLGEQANNIGSVMGVISDIADQTNLLALNAAIEAARAGEAGRGFAVVADEVRKLAEKTVSATKLVGNAIEDIQNGTRKNIENVNNSVASIREATLLANQSGEALKRILHLVESSSDQIRNIATACEEQSAATEEISHNIEEVSKISLETAAAMNDSTLALGEVSIQAMDLKNTLDSLKNGK